MQNINGKVERALNAVESAESDGSRVSACQRVSLFSSRFDTFDANPYLSGRFTELLARTGESER